VAAGGEGADTRSFELERIRFVLVEPRSAGNVGAAARALKNLGFSRLVLVRPACDPVGRAARSMAVDAADVLEAARVTESLDAGLAGAAGVVGTSRRTGRRRTPHHRLDRLAASLADLARSAELAIVFGREDRGLEDDELDRCTHLVRIPSSEAYGSFNLAQSVLLVAYELRRAAYADQAAEALSVPAPHDEREALFAHLREALWAVGFLHATSEAPIMRRLRRLVGRAGATREEVRLLRGLARRILRVAGRCGAPATARRPSVTEAGEERA
jgi:TrmH family RNA methyltransferase